MAVAGPVVGGVPGLRSERRVAPKGDVMCRHNRWDPVSGLMVRCEGSGQPPGDGVAARAGRPEGVGA